MRLTQQFIDNMIAQFGDKIDIDKFFRSFGDPPAYGIRINTLKISTAEFRRISPFEITHIPWTEDGFYVSCDDNPGTHPFYYAGLYYIQEPSAMIPAIMLGAKPGEAVLDLCAAPGGKMSRIAADMHGQGLLAANEINASRAKPLIKNIERLGLENVIVLNENPETLKERLHQFFDRIIVDAPCSGEGMYRKDSRYVREMGNYNKEDFTKTQAALLNAAAEMLKPGGRLVYSTCTFSIIENEYLISEFLSRHNNFSIIDGHSMFPKGCGISHGISCDAKQGVHDATGYGTNFENAIAPILSKAVRIWPHLANGEGHFSVAMRKSSKGYSETPASIYENFHRHLGINNRDISRAFQQFEGEKLNYAISGYIFNKGNYVYSLPEPFGVWAFSLSNLNKTTTGMNKTTTGINKTTTGMNKTEAGLNKITTGMNKTETGLNKITTSMNETTTGMNETTVNQNKTNAVSNGTQPAFKISKHGRFIGEFSERVQSLIPSHSLLLSLGKNQFKNTEDMGLGDVRIDKYLKGETIEADGEPGLTAIAVNGRYLGWGKRSGGMIKNLYPKGWRKMK